MEDILCMLEKKHSIKQAGKQHMLRLILIISVQQERKKGLGINLYKFLKEYL